MLVSVVGEAQLKFGGCFTTCGSVDRGGTSESRAEDQFPGR